MCNIYTNIERDEEDIKREKNGCRGDNLEREREGEEGEEEVGFVYEL